MVAGDALCALCRGDEDVEFIDTGLPELMDDRIELAGDNGGNGISSV